MNECGGHREEQTAESRGSQETSSDALREVRAREGRGADGENRPGCSKEPCSGASFDRTR